MLTCHRDPILADLLNDPITQAVMRADGVDPKELESLFLDVARRRCQQRASERYFGQ